MHHKKSRSIHTIPLARMAPPVQQLGHWAFLIGVLVAIVGGFLMNVLGETAVFSALFALGVVVGLLNITLRETTDFLVATIALIMAGVVNLRLIPYVGVILQTILNNILVFVVPAAVIVALRAVWVLASRE
jgi:hypothetical protein